MKKQQTQQFKEDAIRYYHDHSDLGVKGYASNLGIGYSTLTRWPKIASENNSDVPTRGSGNYSSDIEKENALP